jgi:ferrous iron transport protein B
MTTTITTRTIALVGNPNCGKSSIFNTLTGSHQHVGNWPGVTVEKKEGTLHAGGYDIAVIDLPGAYSLSAYSPEELITRDFILNTKPNVVVAVIDAANLERNLYLVIQLLEMGAPVVIALNMTDVAERRQITINRDNLSQCLGGIPVIPTVGNREQGIDALKTTILEHLHQPANPPLQLDLGTAIEEGIDQLIPLIQQDEILSQQYPHRWLAIKLLEEDEEILERIQANTNLVAAVTNAAKHILAATGEDPDTFIVDGRYGFIEKLTRNAVTRAHSNYVTSSDKLDRILAHRFWGVPIFLFFMWLVFQVTANVSAPFLDWLDGVVNGPISRWMTAILGVLGLGETWVKSLVVDGIIAGVGGVLVFVPVLFSLYLALAILEETGYMARAAFVMERFMHRLGLHGKSFLPLMVGFGCSVPAIYATRTLEDETDRKITGFIIPFMSCGARLPVYVMFGTIFFGAKAGNLIFGMYLLGILIAILTSVLLTRGLLRNRTTLPFMIELPSYHTPNPRMIWRYIALRVGIFLRTAGTIIFFASMGIWFLMAIPAGTGKGSFAEVESNQSVFVEISRVIAPVLEPAGFGTWEASSSLMTGLLAKEVVISTMSQIYVGEEEETGEEGETPTFIDDVQEIAVTFGEASVLTAQETLNIIPRAMNALPGVAINEADFLNTADDEDTDIALENALEKAFTPLQAVAFNVFVLLYIPCMATVAAMRQEFGNRWMLYQSAYMTIVAWIAAVIVYQGGQLVGLG